ncbi:MAG: CBS domain-containing protein [Phycisphaeraceae bacterium]|nr:CBS domain-containing protein [Phycisphaeraceae bacterium]
MPDPVRRRRRAAEPGEFSDPLQKFEGYQPADQLEEALFCRPVTDMQITPFRTFPPELPVREAVGIMAEEDFFCLLICEQDRKLIGLFTERDVLMKVADRLDELGDQPIRDFMTPDPRIIYETDTPAKALNLMAEGGFRHVPVLSIDDKVVGIIGPQRLARYLFTHMGD